MPASVILIIDHRLEKRNSGVDAGDLEGRQGLPGLVDRITAIGAMNNEFGQQRIVIRRHEVAGIAVAVEAKRRLRCGTCHWVDATGAGAETVLRRLGVDAAFDGVAVKTDIRLLARQRSTAGNARAAAPTKSTPVIISVTGMLDLNSCVHLEKKEFAPYRCRR